VYKNVEEKIENDVKNVIRTFIKSEDVKEVK